MYTGFAVIDCLVEIPVHEFLNTSNSALSNSALSGDEIQSHEFLDTSEQPSDLDVSLEIQAHPLLTDSGEHGNQGATSQRF